MLNIWNIFQERYKITGDLGQGAYGTVKLAEDRKTGKQYAIKLIKDVFCNEQHAKYVCREIKVMRHLQSGDNGGLYSAKLHDVIIVKKDEEPSSEAKSWRDTQFDHLFLVQEHFGVSLDTFIKHGAVEICEDHIRVIAYNMLCAAKYVHSAKVVHRDLKPENILINQNCNIKFCDFGFSRSIASSNNERLKSSEMPRTPRIGTRFYRAPEIMLCDPNYDFAVDIWAIGCVIGELLLKFVECESKDQGSIIDGSTSPQPERVTLFKGDSCYPISKMETQTDTDVISKND